MDINQIMKDKPLVHDMADCKEIFWINPQSDQPAKLPFTMADIEDAEARLQRFAPYIAAAFPETSKSGGIIESELTEIPRMKERLVKMTDKFGGRLFLKRDSDLPVSGSIKARGGICEVLKFAEKNCARKGYAAFR